MKRRTWTIKTFDNMSNSDNSNIKAIIDCFVVNSRNNFLIGDQVDQNIFPTSLFSAKKTVIEKSVFNNNLKNWF